MSSSILVARGRWELGEQREKEVDSATGFPDAQRRGQKVNLERSLTSVLVVTGKSEAQRG